MTDGGVRGRLSGLIRRAAARWPFGPDQVPSSEEVLALCSLELGAARASLAADAGSVVAGRNVILCGCPRSGTSLLTAALFQPPRMVTVMEPWEGLCLPTDELFRWIRAEVADECVPNTRLDVRALRNEGRVTWNPVPEDFEVKGTDSATVHGMKWPCYWQLLGASAEVKFLVCVRDPAAVVSSMGRQKGRLPLGLDYDVPFNRELNERLLLAHDHNERRRIAFFDEVYSHALPYQDDANVMFVRYERWFEDPAALLAEISQFLDCDVTSPLVRIEGSAAPSLAHGASDAASIRAMSSTAAKLGYS